MKTKDQAALRILVRAREDFQAIRKAMDNRLGRKANGQSQKIADERVFSLEDITNFTTISDAAKEQEEAIQKMLKEKLERFPIYNDWLKEISGVGDISAGYLLGEFDIEEAVTVSKMTQHAGLNPGLVRGKKRISKKEYRPEMGEIVDIKHNPKKGEDYIISTSEMIKGDRKTPRFLCPYNQDLRTALVGVLADSFLKARSPYAQFYYDLHIPDKYRKDEKEMKKRPDLARQCGRLDLSEKMTTEIRKGGSLVSLPWKDTIDAHRDRAAKRYMIKRFLQDFYGAWRAKEGLPVRKPYEEEYLGHTQH